LVTATVLLAMMCSSGAAALAADGDAYAPSSNEIALKRGDRGAAVKRVQRRLRVKPVSGFFGPLTEKAVKRFQRRRGLTADGVVGPQTREALGLEPVTGTSSESAVKLPKVLRRIAECESGGDPTVVSRDGRYRGKYQFTRATWKALGGSGDPAEASEATQDRLALKLYRRSGTTPWPSCA
jgi:peptidoglycan hydrolase-like protein with peptidoglycan-binding domain